MYMYVLFINKGMRFSDVKPVSAEIPAYMRDFLFPVDKTK